MTETTIGKDQAVALLQKLSTEDDFRASYEKSPSEALKAAGISADILQSLPSANLAPTKLNSKEAFAAALKQVLDDSASVYLCHQSPTVRLHSSNAKNLKDSAGSTSFAAS